MNINSVGKYCNLSFCGIKKPYITPQGVKITPISQNPDESDIKKSIAASEQSSKPMEGLNGYAFMLGEDLVVKKYKGEKAISNDPYREINLLDNLYDYNLRFKNSQMGCYAFETPDGQVYMVSTRVKGKNPGVSEDARFTKENLASLSEIIFEMDKGSIIPASSQNGYSDRCRFMNYDFNGGNIKVTPDTAGLFDFEYDKFENIDDYIGNTLRYGLHGYNCNQSDTSCLPSCMRSFEYWTLCDYLRQTDDADKIFNDYLDIKGSYHAKMADFYKDFALNESAFPDEVKKIARREAAHSRLLRKTSEGRIPADILKSEARKIQMANFLHEQGIFNVTGIINPDQLKSYTAETLDYFTRCLQSANKCNDADRITYYTDCLELVSQWQNVNHDLNRRILAKDESALKKITKEHVKTLDDVLIF